MKIKSVEIKNFRGIGPEGVAFNCSDLNLIIGENGTSKTTILEALNFCLSTSYTASKLSIDDFYLASDNSIEILITFDDFEIEIPDGFATQKMLCSGIKMTAKKREKSAPGKAFNDLVVVEHYYWPKMPKGVDGWAVKRKNGNDFKVTERHLALTFSTAEIPKVFYFSKNRDRQLKSGFNSSVTNVLDDMNWRFEKGQRGKPDKEKFKLKREEIEKYIFDSTDGDTYKKTIATTNQTLSSLGIDSIDLSIIKTLKPYSTSALVKRFDDFELPIENIGSGYEMIVSLVFLETLAQISKEEIVIIIDEPELHLHPALQDKLAKHLEEASKTNQTFLSTHSPFFFKNCFEGTCTSVLITEINKDIVNISNAKDKGFGILSWSPSWGEICYFAYNIPTIEFHDDLYASLQDRENKETIGGIEAWFQSNGYAKEVIWVDALGSRVEETLMTYIRNRIHHGDNQNRPPVTDEQLRESIERMVALLS